MSFIISKRAALALALIALCNAMDRTIAGAQAQLFEDETEELGLIGSRQVSFEPAAEFGAAARGLLAARLRRQAPAAEGSGSKPPQPAAGSNPLGFLNQVGPQLSQSIFGQSGAPAPSGQPGGSQMASALMSQLSDMIHSTQSTQKKAMDATQESLQKANQATQQAAQNAQGGIQSALADIGSGLQRIAANNPNLLPDVKSLYQSVSSKLTSASSSVAQAATPAPSGAQQLAQGVASQIANPQPLPSPSS